MDPLLRITFRGNLQSTCRCARAAAAAASDGLRGSRGSRVAAAGGPTRRGCLARQPMASAAVLVSSGRRRATLGTRRVGGGIGAESREDGAGTRFGRGGSIFRGGWLWRHGGGGKLRGGGRGSAARSPMHGSDRLDPQPPGEVILRRRVVSRPSVPRAPPLSRDRGARADGSESVMGGAGGSGRGARRKGRGAGP